jgi:hypothetical protein
LARDLAPGGEVDNREILVGCDDHIDVGELDGKAADRRPRARGSLQELVPSADRVLCPWDIHRDLNLGSEELSQQTGVIGLGNQAFVGGEGSHLGQFAQTLANHRFRAGKEDVPAPEPEGDKSAHHHAAEYPFAHNRSLPTME